MTSKLLAFVVAVNSGLTIVPRGGNRSSSTSQTPVDVEVRRLLGDPAQVGSDSGHPLCMKTPVPRSRRPWVDRAAAFGRAVQVSAMRPAVLVMVMRSTFRLRLVPPSCST